MNIVDFCARLKGVKKTSNGFEARCPAHDDHRASLSIREGRDGKIILKCHAECAPEAVCSAIGIEMKDLFPARNGHVAKSRIVDTYDYTDETGKMIFQCVRFEPKDFRQRRPDTNGSWVWNLKEVRRVLYRLPDVLQAVASGELIILVEGEKDVASLVNNGFCGTCNPMGAGKWEDGYTETLRGADVVILPDNDEPGRKHAQLVASKLSGVAKRVRVATLPDVANGMDARVKDASDFFGAGGTAEEMRGLIDGSPEWKPGTKIASKPAAQLKQPRCETSKSDPSGIRGKIISILTDGNLSAVEAKTQIAKAVVEALIERGQLFFHSERRDFESAMFFDGERKRLERIRSDAFLAWLSDWLAINRADTLFKYVAAETETAALSSRAKGILPEAFWTSRPGTVYLSNGDGRIVKVTSSGLATVDNGTDGVLFAAGQTLVPWNVTKPVDPFSNCSLFWSLQCAAEHGIDLVRLWIYSLPTCPRSKPPMCLAGDIGSGKTRLAKGIAELYGLPFIASKVEDEGERDFWPNLDQGGLLTLDNADSRSKWLADSLATAATDGCSQRRKLYTDSETVILRARAWICITTANPLFASDAGLADRLLVVRMNRRADENSDALLSEEIAANRDAGLSHIALMIQKALGDSTPVPAALNSRHPDFSNFAVKIGRALNCEARAVAALKAAELDKASFCLENDVVGAALLEFLKKVGNFTGTAAELVPKLVEIDPDLKERLSARRLGKRLSSMWPHLEKALSKSFRETNRNDSTVFTFQATAGFAGFKTAFSRNPP